MTDFPESSIALLTVSGLSIDLRLAGRWVPVVTDVSFSVHRREAFALVGESGCGKTLTALAVIGLLPSVARMRGSVKLDGRELTTLQARARRKVAGREIGFIFQEPQSALHPVLTIGEQLTRPMRVHLGLSRQAAIKRAKDLLEQVQIPKGRRIFQEYPHHLSGGMSQRVVIAMAISCNPRFLIADEPTTALDATVQEQILDLLLGLRRDLGIGLLLISHNLGLVAQYSDRAAVMYAGEIVEADQTRRLVSQPLHPYTIGLLRAVPHLGQKVERLQAIPGYVPAVEEMPVGCRFAERCTVMCEKASNHPDLRPHADGARARCWVPQGDRATS